VTRVRRRQWLVGAAACFAAPTLLLAQRDKTPVIGYLSLGSPGERAHMVDWFRNGLTQGGFADGRDVHIEYRWAEGRLERLPGLAAELVKRNVSVIVTQGGAPPALAAKSATSKIPIVFLTSADPVKVGLVGSLRQPGGNVIGVANLGDQLEAKRLEILREMAPGIKRVFYLWHPHEPDADAARTRLVAAAEIVGLRLDLLRATSSAEIDGAFANLKPPRGSALLVAANGLFTSRREQIVAHAARHALLDSYARTDFVASGGLMNYGPDYAQAYQQVGLYAARLLKGAKAADLPVVQERRFVLAVNAKAAKRLGVAMSRDFLARVDQVIE
jgi:putative tryptophan/tyrosine transport system substrate-binding protein